MIRLINTAFLFSLVFVCSTIGVSAAKIGTALVVKNKVTGIADKAQRRIRRGDGVFRNELINTGFFSKAELKFLDETLLTIGARSSVRLDSFIYNPSDKTGKIVINSLKGAFRFVSGSAQKSAYKIKTPLATIGVRGTIIDGYTDSLNKLSVFILQKGGMEVCSDNTCRNVNKPGDYVIVRKDGSITSPKTWRGRINKVRFGTVFPVTRGVFYADPNMYSGVGGGYVPGGSTAAGGDGSDGDSDSSNSNSNSNNNNNSTPGGGVLGSGGYSDYQP